MLKNIFLSSLVLINLFALQDLGVHGEVKKIEGKSLIDIMEENYQKVDLKELDNKLVKAQKDSLKINSSLPTCMKTEQRTYEPIIILEQDIIVPIENKVLYKKGAKYNLLKEQNINFAYHILFINSDDPIQLELSAGLNKQALSLIAKGDISRFTEKGIEVNIARENQEIKAFNIRCLPTVVTQKEDSFIINEYKPDDLKKDNK